MLDTTTYLPKLKEFEGVIQFMYLDNALPPGPFVTVGVGFLLSNAAAAQKLAFVPRANPAVKATADEIKADFETFPVSLSPCRFATQFHHYNGRTHPAHCRKTEQKQISPKETPADARPRSI